MTGAPPALVDSRRDEAVRRRAPRSTTSTSTSTAEKWSRCSATTAPASRPSSSASAARTASTAERSRWKAGRVDSLADRRALSSGSRRSTRISRSSTTSRRATTSTPGARLPGLRWLPRFSSRSPSQRMTDATRDVLARLDVSLPRIDTHGRAHVGRTAPGGRRESRRRVRIERRDPRRADGRARSYASHGACSTSSTVCARAGRP